MEPCYACEYIGFVDIFDTCDDWEHEDEDA